VGFQVPPVTQNAFLASTSFSTQARRANRDHEGKVIRKNYQINQRKTRIDPRRFHRKILRSDEDTFSAQGAMSALAPGHRPRVRLSTRQSAESAIQWSIPDIPLVETDAGAGVFWGP
jgi:hypothetical protein